MVFLIPYLARRMLGDPGYEPLRSVDQRWWFPTLDGKTRQGWASDVEPGTTGVWIFAGLSGDGRRSPCRLSGFRCGGLSGDDHVDSGISERIYVYIFGGGICDQRMDVSTRSHIREALIPELAMVSQRNMFL